MKCKWPLNHLSISSTGVYRPCCAWEEGKDQPNVKDHNLQEYLESDFYKKLITNMKAGRYGSGCMECIEDEKSGVNGMLYNGDRRYPDKTEFSLWDMEIKFGNICNAGCIMCSPYNSSLIEQENKLNPEMLSFRRNFTSPNENWFEDKDKFREIAILASKGNKIRFTGGEPTVRGLLDDFLSIVVEHNTDLIIQITSNGSSFSKKLQDSLIRFKDVRINLSIDGYGKANDFIRWPIKWDKLEKNIDAMLSYNNIKCNIETSLQAASLDSLPELINWCEQKGIHWNANSVYAPEYLQPFLARQEIIDNVRKLENEKINKLLEYNSSKYDKNKLRNKMISYYDILSKVRKINWKECFDV